MNTRYEPVLGDAGPNSNVIHELVYPAREIEQKVDGCARSRSFVLAGRAILGGQRQRLINLFDGQERRGPDVDQAR